MKKILIGCTAVLLIAIIAIVVAGLLLSTDYEVEESVTIQATPAEIHVLVEDLRRWEEWTPWKEMDPTLETTFGEKTTGVGASYSWTGKDGDGNLTFTASDPLKGVGYEMAFIDGETRFPATGRITYTPVEGGTEVVWTMAGDTDSIPVLGGLVAFSMPYAISPAFQKGLENLKAKVEG